MRPFPIILSRVHPERVEGSKDCGGREFSQACRGKHKYEFHHSPKRNRLFNQEEMMKHINDFECNVIGGGMSPANLEEPTTEPIDPRYWALEPVDPPRDVLYPVPFQPDQAY